MRLNDAGEFSGIYATLQRLSAGRNEADYRLDGPDLTEDEVRAQIKRGERLILNRINPVSDGAFKKLEIPRSP